MKKYRLSPGYFSLELALTAVITLPFALGIFDIMRYIIVHSILKNATARVVRAEKQAEGVVKPLAPQVAEEISYLITVRGIAFSYFLRDLSSALPSPLSLRDSEKRLQELTEFKSFRHRLIDL